MKHSDYFIKLQQNSNYVDVHNELKLQFKLGAAIVRARIAKGWTQTDLAKRAGTKQANISRIEDASANPTFKTISKILSVLGIEAQFISTGDNSITTEETVHLQTPTTGIHVPNWPIYQNKDISNSEGTMQ